MTTITPHQASYLAHELQRKYSSETLDKLTASLHDAQVDLNPHQVEAALFAFHSPLSAGAILADEVGLGKTIEAGLVISQWWAARQRKILIITPATLRKQWSGELAEKFFLPSVIMEKKVFDETLKRSSLTNPFAQESAVIILSHEFARSKQDYIQQISWDLVVIDEAHRLRNVYKGNKTGTALKEALKGRKKILLTATPLQNSLMEMYGLVSLIDEHIFGDDVSFREQFVSRSGSRNIQELRERLAQVCKRTLRKHVREYISYTERRCISHDFFPTDEETTLYNYLNAYLQEERLFALPNRQRQLITLVVRKMLASSTFAISGTLAKFLQRLRDLEMEQQPTELSIELLQELADDFGVSDEFNDEIPDEKASSNAEGNDKIPLSAEELRDLRREIEQLEKFYTLATSITANTKAEALCTALDKAFVTLDGLGAPRKAIIFTEFARTQTYLKQFLEQHGFAGEIVLFNGSNNDADSQRIYKAWLERHKGSSRIAGSKTADMRAALVEEFRQRATLMIATEAAAEGINLQFCSLVVNYDLPWNPQRIEQRIGRCHRYGQKFDVVVVNLVNQKNPVDKRVYDVLGAKFRLFDGVFGASDDVLGALESGVDFEQRINAICNECRTEEEIARAFDALQHELQDSINIRLQETHNALFENFDRHVIDKLHVSKQQTEERLTAFEQRLWECTRFALGANAEFAADKRSFVLTTSPCPDRADIPLGNYRLSRHFRIGEQDAAKQNAVQQSPSTNTNPDITSDAHVYRLSHPLAEHCIKTIKQHHLPPACLVFDCSGTRPHVFGLQPLIGRAGWLRVSLLTVTAFETEDFFLFSACTDDGKMFETLDSERCEQLLSLSANIEPLHSTLPENTHQYLLQSHAEQQARFAGEANLRTMRFYDEQSEKLDTWEDDALSAYTLQMKSIKDLIKLRKGEMKTITTAAEKIAAQRGIQELQQRSNDLQREQFQTQTDIAGQKKTLLDGLEKEIEQQLHVRELFTVQWRII